MITSHRQICSLHLDIRSESCHTNVHSTVQGLHIPDLQPTISIILTSSLWQRIILPHPLQCQEVLAGHQRSGSTQELHCLAHRYYEKMIFKIFNYDARLLPMMSVGPMIDIWMGSCCCWNGRGQSNSSVASWQSVTPLHRSSVATHWPDSHLQLASGHFSDRGKSNSLD